MKKIYLSLVSIFLFAGLSRAQLVIFDDDYAAGVSFAAFGGSTNALAVDAAEARPGSAGTKSLRIGVPSGGYTGGAMVSAAPSNASAFNAVSFWIKASKSATLNVVGIGNNNGGSSLATELDGAIALTTTWQRIIIPVPDPAKLTGFNGLWHFAEGGDEGPYNIWVDDIQYETIGGGAIGAPSSASMNNQNLNLGLGGTLQAQSAKATIPVNATPVTLRVGAAFLTYTCDPVGRVTFDANGTGTAQTAGAAVVTATLGTTPVTGTINVNISAGGTAPTLPAPTPDKNASNVISIFSDAYTPVTSFSVADFTPNGNTATVIEAAGNNVLEMKIPGGVFHGFNLGDALNLTPTQFMHYDIWVAGTTQVGAIFNTTISQHGGGHLTGQTLGYVHTNPIAQGQEGKWLSFDIPYSSFAPDLQAGARNIISQFVFTHVNLSNSGPIYVDNIYFWSETPVPVTLTKFDAARGANGVMLNWQTATEVNNQGFEVQRSTDGNRFTPLQFVNGAGNSNTQQSYSLLDNAPAEGVNYYRLKQIDSDGRFSFSAVKAIVWNSNQQLTLYPNPAHGRVNVAMANATGNVSYTILDMQGKRLSTGFAPVTNGAAVLDIRTLAPGAYMVQMNNGKLTMTTKLVVQ